MKRILLGLMLTLMPALVYSQHVTDSIAYSHDVTGRRDTTVFYNAKEVMIITTDSTQTVRVARKMAGCMLGGDPHTDEVYEKTTRISNSILSATSKFFLAPVEPDTDEVKIHTHFAIGITAPTNVPNSMSFSTWESVELMWTVGQIDYTPRNCLQTYSVGLGFTWHNFFLKTNKMFTRNESGYIDLADYPAGAERRWSNMHYWSLSVPLLFTQRFDRRGLFKLTVGAIVNLNKSGYIKNTYEINHLEYDVRANEIENRPVTVDLIGIMKVYGIGLYCRYSPFSVLKDYYGPQFHSLSFGLYF